jgi:hypothetical protein
MLYPAELRARVARTLARQHPKASPGTAVPSIFTGLFNALGLFGNWVRHLLRPGEPQEPAAGQPVAIRKD